MNQTNSQIVQQYVMDAYPCIRSWIDFVGSVVPLTMQYDSISCYQVSMIGRSTMRVFDYLVANESNCSVIRVARMMSTLHDTAWRTWTAFNAQSAVSTGTRSLTISASALQDLRSLYDWDSALDPNPSAFNPPILLDSVLSGVIA